MNDIFPGYYPKSTEELEKLWNDSLLFFDTNTLTNLYRYSEATRSEFLTLIESFKERIYLTHQVGLEYNENRIGVITDLEKDYEDFKKAMEQISSILGASKTHPFFSKSVESKFVEAFDAANAEIDSNLEKYKGYIREDPIYTSISKLFDGRVVGKFDNERLTQIFKEGEDRYKNKIPPGFKDTDKTGNRIYGDLVLWNQLLEYAKEKNKNIILVTDDNKEDWWWKLKGGKTFGPRQELISEMKSFANVEFHMYSSERFLAYGSKYLDKTANADALSEIESIKKMDQFNIIERMFNDSVSSNTEILNEEELAKNKYKVNDMFDRSLKIISHIESQNSKNSSFRNTEEYRNLIEELYAIDNDINSTINNPRVFLSSQMRNIRSKISDFLFLEDLLT